MKERKKGRKKEKERKKAARVMQSVPHGAVTAAC